MNILGNYMQFSTVLQSSVQRNDVTLKLLINVIRDNSERQSDSANFGVKGTG
jgi:hypothetical protein